MHSYRGKYITIYGGTHSLVLSIDYQVRGEYIPIEGGALSFDALHRLSW